MYRPYRRRGDTINMWLRTSGYVTNGGTDVAFFVPFAAPILGAPTPVATSNNGFQLRQNDKYTHGSSASEYAKPASYPTVELYMWNGVYVVARFSNTTNVTNNAPIGIYWSGYITFE